MRQKKAWLRIVEATIAIMIIATVLLLMIVRTPKKDNYEQIHETQRFILEQINKNDTLRNKVLQYDITTQTPSTTIDEITLNAKELLPPNFEAEVKICNVGEVCGMTAYQDKEVYADEILITSTLTEYKPRKIKLYIWNK